MGRPGNTTPDDARVAAARQARLHYVTDQGSGITRVARGGGFLFRAANGKPVSAGDEQRIRALAIPPAWQKVWICPRADGHLQATGIDARGRKQYRYHAQWHAVRTLNNFHSLAAFARALPGIRRAVARELRRPGLPRPKVVAAAIAILEQTHIRVGNAEYAEENRSFGLSTLRDRHAVIQGNRLHLRFRGKSGKFHRLHLDNRRLVRIVQHCRELPGYELFQYLDESGQVHDLTSDHINDYLRTLAGADFTAKDFRTWAGTVGAAVFLRDRCADAHRRPTKAALIAAYDNAAAELGNTRAVCRRHYVHPAIGEAFLDGSLPRFFAPDGARTAPHGLKPDERAVVRLLESARRAARAIPHSEVPSASA